MTPLADQLRGDGRLSRDLDGAYETLMLLGDMRVCDVPTWILDYPEVTA